MFAKQSIAKTKLTYTKNKKDELTINITVSANHSIDQNTLENLERYLNSIHIPEYTVDKRKN